MSVPPIVTPFPAPPPQVRQALTSLLIAHNGDLPDLAELGDVDKLPRPWDPAGCPAPLRHQLWLWCDQVADWINQTYAWRPTSMIPACWPDHPHLAAELPVLACLRAAAGHALTPDPIEEWHRYALPMFTDRMTARLGESGCRTGRHIDWPADSRHHHHTEQDAERRQRFRLDTHPPTPLRATRRA